jgi:predicted TIM-barrel fold metal-dependent hydrolase
LRAVQYAEEEARQLSPTAGTDSRHLLIGLAREPEGRAAEVLAGFGVTVGRLREEAGRHRRHRPHTEGQRWSSGAQQALEQALAIAQEAGRGRPPRPLVDTEHLLLALVRSSRGGATQLLRGLGVTPEQVERALRGDAARDVPRAIPKAEPALSLVDVTTRYGYNPNTGLGTIPEDVKRAGARWGVRQAYTFSLNAALQDARQGNQETLELCDREAFFRPAAVISPVQYRPAKLVEWVKERGFGYVRLFPDLHGYAVDGQACRDLLAACGAVGLPVMIPVLAAGAANLLRGLDGLRVTSILTNVRYSVLGEVLALAGRLPGLYVETSVLNTPDGVALVADAFGPERVLFGSEYPLLEVGCAALLLQQSGLSPEQIARIGSGNARRLLEGKLDA